MADDKDIISIIKNRAASEPDEDAVIDYLKPRLSRIKLPAYIMFCKAFPYLSNGKLDGVSIKQMAEVRFGT